jgi:hypothetical protein
MALRMRPAGRLTGWPKYFRTGVVVAYNPWYTATYLPILDIADWSLLTADLERKVIAIFSWMPKTIMAINHAGKRYKWEIHSIESMYAALEPMQERFSTIQNEHLKNFVISRHRVVIVNLFDTLSPIMGPVAASKYMHFSAPQLLPMWDNVIRKDAGCEATGNGYVHFMAGYQRQLRVLSNYREAIDKCPHNAVRGWDMVLMERR